MTALLLSGNQKLRAQTLPYSNSFEASDTSFHLNHPGDTLSWKLANGGISSSRCLLSEYVTNSSGNNADRYFASKRLNLVAGNTYRVSFQTKVQYANRRKIKLALNSSSSRAGSTLIHDFDTINSDSYQPFSTNFSVDSSGQYFLIYYGENIYNHPECLWYTDDFSVTVINTPPSVTLVEPTNNSWFNPDQSVGFAATVSDGENNVAKVEFYEGANKVAEDFTPNGLGLYTGSYLPANGGAQTLTAKVIDSLGASATSNSRTINVRYLPQASITNLTPYSKYFPGLQRVTATASDPDGTVQYVVFYLNEDSIGTDSTAPYEMDVPLVFDAIMLGHYIYARAVDNDGLVGSDAVRINVIPGTCELTTPNSTLHQTLCWGDSIALSSEGEDGTTGFQWMFKANPEDSWSVTSSNKPKKHALHQGYYAIKWFYENNAVCTTAVDTVDWKVGLIINELVTFQDSKYVGVQAFGGDAPYNYNWVGFDSCLSMLCDSVKLNDQYINNEVTVIDANGCQVKGFYSASATGGCGGYSIRQDELNNFSHSPSDFKTEQEKEFQRFMEAEKISENQSSNHSENGVSEEKIIIPVVFFIANNNEGPVNRPASEPYPFNGPNEPLVSLVPEYNIPTNYFQTFFTASRLQSLLDATNNYLANNPVTLNGVDKTIVLCKAKYDNVGDPIPNEGVYFVNLQNVPYGRTDLLFNTQTNISPRNFLRIAIGNNQDRSSSWGFPASEIFNNFWNNGTNRDGVFLHFQYFGPIAPGDDPYFHSHYLNKTGAGLLHELGHYLDLQHTFSPAGIGVTCSDNNVSNCRAYQQEANNIYYQTCDGYTIPQHDFVKDTPPQSVAWNTGNGKKNANGQYTIPATNLSGNCIGGNPYQNEDFRNCSTSGFTVNEVRLLLANAMGNTIDDCVDNKFGGRAFSLGQRERMYYALKYYRNDLISPRNLIDRGVSCTGSFATFTYSGNYICGNTVSSNIKVNPLQIPNATYTWALSGLSGTITPNSGTSAENTITINSTVSGTAVVTLTVVLNGVSRSSTMEIFFDPVCPSLNQKGGNLFFGKGAGLDLSTSAKGPIPNFDAYNSGTNRIFSKGGAITYTNPTTGSLGFYASGSFVWDNNHNQLSGVTLLSDDGASQYGIAVPSPAEEDEVWFFTVPKYATGTSNFSGSGLRWHKVNLANFSASTWNLPVPYVSGSATTGGTPSAKVGEKITAIPKGNCVADGYWLIVQGGKGTGTEDKFLVYSITTAGLSNPTTYSAKFASESGFIKPSPNGDKLIVTYTNVDAVKGTGTGENSWVFPFDKSTGVINSTSAVELVVPSLPSAITKTSAYGCAFSQDGTQAYLCVNTPDYRDATLTPPANQWSLIAGIYRFSLGNSGPITGTKIPKNIPFGISYSSDLYLASDQKIYISNTLNPEFYSQVRQMMNNPNTEIKPRSSRSLGVIHFPNSASNPGLTWEGPALIDAGDQMIYSSGGLNNSIESYLEPLLLSGLTQTDPLDLGTNPGIGCCHVYSEVNVACTGNDEAVSTTGNDYFYKFKVQRASINDPFLELRVSSVMCDFGTNTDLEFKNNLGGYSLVDGTNQGNGKYWIISGEEIALSYAPNNLLAEFRLTVDALSPTALGNYKVSVGYHDPEDTQPSCCRMAVNGPPEPVFSMPSPKPVQAKMAKNLIIYPNPSTGIFTIDGLSGQNPSIELSDLAGRSFPANLLEENRLDVRNLAKGVYHLKIFDNDRVLNQKIIVQ